MVIDNNLARPAITGTGVPARKLDPATTKATANSSKNGAEEEPQIVTASPETTNPQQVSTSKASAETVLAKQKSNNSALAAVLLASVGQAVSSLFFGPMSQIIPPAPPSSTRDVPQPKIPEVPNNSAPDIPPMAKEDFAKVPATQTPVATETESRSNLRANFQSLLSSEFSSQFKQEFSQRALSSQGLTFTGEDFNQLAQTSDKDIAKVMSLTLLRMGFTDKDGEAISANALMQDSSVVTSKLQSRETQRKTTMLNNDNFGINFSDTV